MDISQLLGLALLGGIIYFVIKHDLTPKKIQELEVEKEKKKEELVEVKQQETILRQQVEEKQKDATEEEKTTFWKDFINDKKDNK